MEFVTWVANGFMSLFQAGGETFLGWVTGIIPMVVCLMTAINSIINIYMFGPLLIFAGVLIVGVLYQLDKKYPAIMKELAEREARGEL